MLYADTVDVALQECRFLLNRRVLLELLPDIDRSVPPLTWLEYMDASQHRTVLGYPLAGSSRLLGDLLRLVVTELGTCLADPERAVDVRSLDDGSLRQDPYVRRLLDLLVRSSSHGDDLRLDGVVWLQIARLVAGLLNNDDGLTDEIRRTLPREAAKSERYLVDLLRLKGVSPSRHAAVKNQVLRALFARHDFAISLVAEVQGDVYSSQLYREMVANRLIFSESAGGLHTFFDLREAFAVRDFGIDLDEFLNLNRTLRAIAEDAWRGRIAGTASNAEGWFADRFVTEELLQKAARLNLADAGGKGGPQDDEGLPERVAWLLCLQPDASDYLLAHLDRFDCRAAAGRRFDLKKDFLRRLKEPRELAGQASAYRLVVSALLRWDFFSALRSFLRDVQRGPGARLGHDGRPLRPSVVAIDLASDREMYSRRRHGTAVFLDISGFAAKATDLFGADDADTDFAALCLRQILQVRRTIGTSRARTQHFTDGLLLDVFPRALDALRYVGIFRVAFDRSRQILPRPWDEPRANPFAEGLRVAMATGDFVEVAIPREATGMSGEDVVYPVGQAIGDARRLVEVDAQGQVPPLEEYDPLEVFKVRLGPNGLHNGGVASQARTFREIVAALRLEGLPAWTQAEPDVPIAGRRIAMKNYRFQLIFDDPATGQVVLVRRLDGNLPGAADGEGPLYEYLMMWPDAFQAFLDRVQETERHQPALRRRSQPGTVRPAPPAAGALGARRRRATLADSPPAPEPAPPPLPPEALNLPEDDDFQFPDAVTASAIELRLGLGARAAVPTSQAPAARPGDEAPPPLPVAAQAAQATPPAPDPSAGDDLSGGFDWTWRDEGDDELTAPGRVGLSMLAEEPRTPDTGISAAWPVGPAREGPPPSEPASGTPPGSAEDGTASRAMAADDALAGVEDFGAAWGLASGPREMPGETPAEAPPAGSSWPEQGDVADSSFESTPSRSLLGSLDDRFAVLLRRTEKELMQRSHPALVPARPAGPAQPRKERIGAPRPDLHVLFKDYVYFWVGEAGGQGSELAIGRRYRDVFFDLHRFRAPASAVDWGLPEAIREFLRQKTRTNFVPQSLSYEALPEGAGEQYPLSIERLEDAFDSIT